MAESQKKQTSSKKTKTAEQAKPASEAEDFDFTGVPAEVKTDLLEIEEECVSEPLFCRDSDRVRRKIRRRGCLC